MWIVPFDAATSGVVTLAYLGPDRGRLSKGACDSHFERRGSDGALLVPDHADAVYFSTTCASKSALVPYCFSSRTQHAGIGAARSL